jgi:hypothetical protein
LFALFDKISVHGKNLLEIARLLSESVLYKSASDVRVCEVQQTHGFFLIYNTVYVAVF